MPTARINTFLVAPGKSVYAGIANPAGPTPVVATAFTLTLASATGIAGSTVAVNVTPNAALESAGVVTLSASGSGVLGVSTLSFAAGATAAKSTTISLADAGSTTITMTNNVGLLNTGSPKTYTAIVASVGPRYTRYVGLSFVRFNSFGTDGRYNRFINNIFYPKAIIAEVAFSSVNYVGADIPLMSATYNMTARIGGDGATVTVGSVTITPNTITDAKFLNVDLTGLPDGWHLFDIVPQSVVSETYMPFWMHVGDPAITAATATWAPTQNGTFSITHESKGIGWWTKKPLPITPPAHAPLTWRECTEFNTTPSPTQFFRRDLCLSMNGDPPFLRYVEAHDLRDAFNTTKGALHNGNFGPAKVPSCLNHHAYNFGVFTGSNPPTLCKDGFYADGLLSGATALQVGRERFTDGAKSRATTTGTSIGASIYFSDPWSFGKVQPSGEIIRLVGYVHTPAGRVLRGDWSSMPVERRRWNLIWGFAWDDGSVAVSELDNSRTVDRGDGILENPHKITSPPTLFVADSLGPNAYGGRGRLTKVVFGHDNHATVPVVTEFGPHLENCWDVVYVNGRVIASVRKQHRIVELDGDTGAYIRDIIPPAPNADSMAYVNKYDHVTLTASRDYIRQNTVGSAILPEGLAYQDGWLYWGSFAAAQVRKVNLTTGEIRLHCNVPIDRKTEYVKIALSDGTFGPRGTVFISSWETVNYSIPYAFLPDGTQWNTKVSGSSNVFRGAGGNYGDTGYSTACAVGLGRLIYSGADYGLGELSLKKTGEVTISQGKHDNGYIIYEEAGHRLLKGVNGYGESQAEYDTLPWDLHPDVRYYLESNGHVEP